jgi:hypothetical protein
MKLKELPVSYDEWVISYAQHLNQDLEKSKYSIDLFKQYRKHLGSFRYRLLLETQKLVVPDIVRDMLGLQKFSLVKMILPFYKGSRSFKLDSAIRSLILPARYRQTIKALDQPA